MPVPNDGGGEGLERAPKEVALLLPPRGAAVSGFAVPVSMSQCNGEQKDHMLEGRYERVLLF